MRLTAYTGGAKRQRASRASTTTPGWVNGNGQEVIARTGQPSKTFRGQVIYELKCRRCTGRYGSNGCDIHARRCPLCDNGAAGEPLVERAASLFE
ncbi:MAG TPA: hypothetical protein VM865_09870 [Acidobacteriaceae bacterium]|nr:hypothetical protein [Acidobacteriaceae bacterium]